MQRLVFATGSRPALTRMKVAPGSMRVAATSIRHRAVADTAVAHAAVAHAARCRLEPVQASRSALNRPTLRITSSL
jgi:hypothetical protein